MKIEFRRDCTARQVRVVIIAPERNAEVEDILRRLQPVQEIVAYSPRGETMIPVNEIIRVYTQQRRVLVDCKGGTFSLRSRLYEMEEKLDEREFVRISNSEIVNKRCILHMDFSLTGTIRLSLRDGGVSYVSRRYVARIRKIFEGEE